MMRTRILAVLFTCLSLAGSALAADTETKAPAGAAPAGEVTKTGTVGVKPTTAPADVVAVLYTADLDYKLLAGEDIAKKLEELAKKMAKVQVTGVVTGDKLKVSQVAEVGAKATDKADTKDKKDAKDAKADRKKKKKDQTQ